MTQLKGNILVVDDEPDIGEMLREILQLEGYRVAIAPSGRAALGLAQSSAFDAALVDINMPGMTGIELIGKLRDSSPNVKIIVVTAFVDESITQAALVAGGHTVFSKPIDFDALSDAIENIIAGKNPA